MDGFSANAASTIALSIATQSQTTASQITSAIGNPSPSPNVAPSTTPAKLAFLSTRLQQLSQHAHQLGEALLDAKAVAGSLQAGLSEVLPEADADVGRLAESVGKVKGEDVEGGRIDEGSVDGWVEVMAAVSRVVIFATQILTIDNEAEQERRMDHEEAKELFTAPGLVRKRVSLGELVKSA
ncbi:hypothetical protein B0T16DRAFT_453383 [Cercophora newfieldiana]|uniref:Uncharacterized protein n=1 Tax=Cercophora newfieldiana TaxID=92897 RepID=A0AA39YUR9_9PEZI|nr:hypothetical protein B0T16DRAFT_453383 [Cercophora newfieldiana]